MYGLKRLFNPEIYQGKNQKNSYFEGWYYKCVDEDGQNIVAFIPGISKGGSPEDSHCFIQVIDGSRNRSGYFTFPSDDFKYSEDRLELHIGANSFSTKGLTLSLKDRELAYEGSLSFLNPQPFPKTLWNPGIMGPFGFLSFMECYHGVVHVRHELAGKLKIDGEVQDFTNGLGYIEKDWGTSFPDSWIWIQCNHFTQPNVSFMLSFAHIPFVGRSFNGLIAFLSVNRKIYRFSTYQGSRVTSLDYEDGVLTVLAEGRHHALSVTVTVEPGSHLKAPKKGTMATTILESMTSRMHMVLIEKDGSILFEGDGSITGVEICGNLSGLY